MLSYIIKRLLNSIPTLAVLITASFFLMRAAPGGPFDGERPLPEPVRQNLNKYYHFDKPKLTQFYLYLEKLVQGDLGYSMKRRDQKVTDVLANSFPKSLQLGIFSVLLALCLGVPLGIMAALKQNKPTDYSVMTFSMVGIVIPTIVSAPLLATIFSVWLGWLPSGRWGDGSIKYLLLPITSLALPQVAYIARMMRGSMIEVLRSNFIRTAKAKGLPYSKVITSHALKPALMPIISYLGPAIAAVITGSLIIEQVYSLPGTGAFFVKAAFNRDYTLVMGLTIFYGMLIIGMNLIVDLLYGFLDPRIRYE